MGKFFPYFFTLLALTSVSAHASTLDESKLPIKHYMVETETPRWLLESSAEEIFSIDQSMDQVNLNEILNYAKEAWEFIVENKAVLNVSHLYANALPRGVRNSEDLDSFSDLQHKSYRAFGKNPMGITVYDVTYTVVHRYNGNYRGRGKYLENVSVIPSHVSVVWGYTLDVAVTKTNVVNVGTPSKPIGSLALELTTKVSTVLKASETRSLFQFRGDSKDFVKM